MARIGCQIKGTGKAVAKASFGGVAAITDAIGTAVPASTLTTGLKTQAASQAEKKETEKPKKMKRGGDVQPPRSRKYYRSTKSGAGMTAAGVARYRRENPGSKLKTAVTEDKPGPKRAARRKSYCARSLGQLKRSSAKTRNDPNSRIRQARRRWKC
jgi:hypothetical protein